MIKQGAAEDLDSICFFDKINMRSRLYVLIFILVASTVSAQQVTQYTQYQMNHFGINPALAGIKPCVDMRLGYRKQWLGLEGAPTTAFANVNGRIPMKKHPMFKGIHGVGAMVETDETGPTGRTVLMLAYAYHQRLRGKLWASVGIFAGFQQYRFDISRVTVPNYNDPALAASQSVMLIPDISPGVWLYHDDYYGGIVLRQVIRKNLNPIGMNSTLTHHWMVEAGKRFKRFKGPTYTPSVMLKFAPMSTPDIDINLLVEFRNQFQVGASYRYTDAIAAMFKVKFLRYFSLGYSFDFTTSRLRVASSNTHEIMLGIYSCPKTSGGYPPCPAYN